LPTEEPGPGTGRFPSEPGPGYLSPGPPRASSRGHGTAGDRPRSTHSRRRPFRAQAWTRTAPGALEVEEGSAVTELPARVTAPTWAKARPCIVAPVAKEMDLWARMFP